jgi:hypothetical protein
MLTFSLVQRTRAEARDYRLDKVGEEAAFH